MGVQKQPGCLEGFVCEMLTEIEDNIAYLDKMQDHLAPAGYFRNRQIHSYYDQYLWYSRFLPYINNEIEHPKKEQYFERFTSLNKLMLVQF